MADIITSPGYDPCRLWIELARSKGQSWSQILSKGTQVWLNSRIAEFWPLLNEEQWVAIVNEKKEAEETSLQASRNEDASADDAMLGSVIDADIRISNNERSCWMLYKKHLISNDWEEESIKVIESNAYKCLQRMKRDTANGQPVKGLVVGHVQSGKTANMAGMMAIGADNGYNMFIVLSGTIENLRQQTQNRLFQDLHPQVDLPRNLKWHSLHHLSRNSLQGQRAQDLDFSGCERYMTVSLKNPTRLRNLLTWLKADRNKLAQMRIVIIDDEADQASINTADVDSDIRTKINGLIVQLTQVQAKAVNYVSYTATPYANFLNETYPESLYPTDFIITLPQSSEHFGPGQLFGLEGRANADGLNIIREINIDDIGLIGHIHNGREKILPESLKDSVAWFLCAAAAKRLWRQSKPVSMLVHTSQRVLHHKNIALAIANWLTADQQIVSTHCKNIWQRETATLTVEDFKSQFPDYHRIVELRDYPQFEEIRNEISTLICNVSHILLDSEGVPTYHSGIHLCIDNSANNGINDENQIVRLAYPKDALDFAAGFIIVGGSTLSRGLTLEGLVSTYFMRDSNQLDTLMQMGRWFGYRRNYELLPRIWMSSNCREKFEYMALVEKELREELRGYMEPPFTNPADFAPRVMNSPSLNWLRPTAKKRMQLALPVNLDFSGANNQTTMFSLNQDVLEANICVTGEFLEGLPSPLKSFNGNALVWRDIDFSSIARFLTKFTFHPRSRLFGNIQSFIDWYCEIDSSVIDNSNIYSSWNVVAAGILNSEHGKWVIGGYSVNKVKRTRLTRKIFDDSLAIGVLRAPSDLLADALGLPSIKEEELDNDTIRRLREGAELGRTPQLLIYRISKESRADTTSKTREDLATPADLIGISIWIPTVRDKKGNPNFARALQAHIPKIAIESDSDIC